MEDVDCLDLFVMAWARGGKSFSALRFRDLAEAASSVEFFVSCFGVFARVACNFFQLLERFDVSIMASPQACRRG